MQQLVRGCAFLAAWLFLGPVFGSTGQIVFSANLGTGGAEIYTVSPDGQSLTQLTDSPGWDGEPVWSPDGSRIAFSSSRSGDRDIWVMNADGSDLVTVVSGPGDQRLPSWSPDGSSLAYVSDERFLGYLAAPENVFIADLGAGRSEVLSDIIVGQGKPVWSPDGTHVIFSAACTDCRDYSTNIVSVSTDGRDRIDVTLSEGSSDAYPVLSPNGTTVVFVRKVLDAFDSFDELWSVNSDGTGPQRIRSDLLGGSAPTISPDGRHIVLENYTCVGTPVCLLDSFSGQETQLFEGLEPKEGSVLNMGAPDWGCCPGPGRGGVALANRADGTTVDDSLSSLLNLGVGGGATTANLNVQGVSVAVSGLWGGGFQNMIVEANDSTPTLLMAGDNSGVHSHTIDHWAPSSKGFERFKQSREVASIGVHPDPTKPEVWAATTGGVYHSTNNGKSWTRKTFPTNSNVNVIPQFRGNNNASLAGTTPLSTNHPRSTGQLLVVDGGSVTKLYAASAQNGLWRSRDNGTQWDLIALPNHYLRSVVQHSSGSLYVASLGTVDPMNPGGDGIGGGIYEVCAPGSACAAPSTCSGPNSSPCVFRKLTSSGEPNKPEELVFGPATDDRLWCACGTDGVWRSGKGKSNFDQWDDHSDPNPNNTTGISLPDDYIWTSIDIGDFDGAGNPDVVAGAVTDDDADDGALQWTAITNVKWRDVVDDMTAVEDEPVCDTGTPGLQWWVAHPEHAPTRRNLLVNKLWDTGFIKFIGDDLYITGRSGAWRMSDSGDGSRLKDKTPCAFVQGLASTANRAIDAGPEGTNSNHVIIGNTDFDAISSTNGLEAVVNPSAPGGIVMHKISGLTVGFDVDYNSDAPIPYALIGAGKRDKPDVAFGEAYRAEAEDHAPTSSDANPDDDFGWRIVGVGAATQPNQNGTRREVAVVTGLSDVNGAPKRGIYSRLGGGGNWIQQQSTGISASDTEFTRIPIEWGRKVPQSGIGLIYTRNVFLLDRDSGIWRSKNWGVDWVQIWTPNNLTAHFPTAFVSDPDFIGFMAINPIDQNQLVFSSNEGLFEISQATSCNSCMPTTISPPAGNGMLPDRLGPVGFSEDGHLVVSSRVEDANDRAEIWVDDGAGLEIKVDDDPIFNSAAFALTDMAITANGDIFLSSRGQGAIVVSGAVP